MSKKRLDENTIVNELKGGSLFFQKPEPPPPVATPSNDPVSAPVMPPERSPSEKVDISEVMGDAILEMQRKQTNEPASTHASTLTGYPDSLINDIRKIVKSVGKEVSFVRLTPAEKNRLLDIVYTYKRQGIKTSENEINRIAVNFLLEDYQANGSASVLAKVIDALLA